MRKIVFSLSCLALFGCGIKAKNLPTLTSDTVTDQQLEDQFKSFGDDEGGSGSGGSTTPSPSPTPPTLPPDPNCLAGGVKVDNVCFYLSDLVTAKDVPRKNCTETCTNRGGYDAATTTLSGNEAGLAKCRTVLDKLLATGAVPGLKAVPTSHVAVNEWGDPEKGAGCVYVSSGSDRALNYSKTYAATANSRPSAIVFIAQRFCGCKK